jgi:hypothetical protein
MRIGLPSNIFRRILETVACELVDRVHVEIRAADQEQIDTDRVNRDVLAG